MSRTIVQINGPLVEQVVGFVLLACTGIGLALAMAGCLWLGLLLLSKIEEAIIYRFNFNRDFIAFVAKRAMDRRSNR